MRAYSQGQQKVAKIGHFLCRGKLFEQFTGSYETHSRLIVMSNLLLTSESMDDKMEIFLVNKDMCR